MRIIIFCIGVLVLFSNCVFASSVDIIGATDDTYINNHSAHDDQNWNSETSPYGGTYSKQLSLTNSNASGDGVHDLVIKFDLTPYIGQTVQSATINLYRVVPVWPYSVDLYYKNIAISYFNGSWSENTITWNNAPSSTYVKTMNIGNGDSYFNCWVPIDITEIAELWLSGAVQNNGVRMHVTQIVVSNFWTFQRSEESANVPVLTLTFDDPEPEPVPEPATVILLALSAVGLLRRKVKS